MKTRFCAALILVGLSFVAAAKGESMKDLTIRIANVSLPAVSL